MDGWMDAGDSSREEEEQEEEEVVEVTSSHHWYCPGHAEVSPPIPTSCAIERSSSSVSWTMQGAS